ncbi:hypothetical protein PoB_000698700 [Plakobranchus ocellatus]|uniref:Uncharacterized protein n=1 Tax=Plakobranchus ocellatus TaxID=259542 RepID=A0AAV3YEA9_9GAST|nr:hypothetical protein PoB_000698700 [Plakobranchus ocellatus]
MKLHAILCSASDISTHVTASNSATPAATSNIATYVTVSDDATDATTRDITSSAEVTEGHVGHTNNRREETLLSCLRIGHTRNHRDFDSGLTLPLLVAHNEVLSSESLVCSGKRGRL